MEGSYGGGQGPEGAVVPYMEWNGKQTTILKIYILPFGVGIVFLILSHPVYKMRIIQEPNTLEL